MMNSTTPTHHSRLPVEVSINDNLPTSSPRGKTVFNVLACVLGLIFLLWRTTRRLDFKNLSGVYRPPQLAGSFLMSMFGSWL